MNRLRALGIGARVIRDWLGCGGVPVPQQQAELRAHTCIHGYRKGRACPHNWRGDWWTRVEARIAETVMEQRRARLGLNLRLPNEEKLGVCDICLCPLANKVFVPFTHIERHTPDDVWQELPRYCWMIQEREK